MKLDASDNMNKTTSAMSVAYAILPKGIRDASCAVNFSISSLFPLASVPPRASGVSVTPGKLSISQYSS
jgi:hypothetical protein